MVIEESHRDTESRRRPPRAKTLRVRLTEAELENIKEIAAASGKSASHIVRESVASTRVRLRDAATVKADQDRLVVLNRINAHLGFIARWAKEGLRPIEAVEVVARLVVIERDVMRHES